MEVGVLDAEHRNQLVGSARLLATPLKKMHSNARPETVDEWLHLLRLDHYAEQFHKNRYDDMERVGRIWEVELTTVVEIRLVGHLRRILVSLGDSVTTCPTKTSNGYLPSSHAKSNQDDLTTLSSDLQMIVSPRLSLFVLCWCCTVVNGCCLFDYTVDKSCPFGG